MVNIEDNQYYCSLQSKKAFEKIFGTASITKIWVLLEFNGLWAKNIGEGRSVPEDIKNWIRDNLNSFPDLRLLFIKQKKQSKDSISLFIIISNELESSIYRFTILDYSNLVNFSIKTILNDKNNLEQFLTREPLFLICTHGKNDKCCAKFGIPIYKEFELLAGSSAWECSHVGGDRFASNVVVLPYGYIYGHIEKNEVALIIERTMMGNVFLEKLRGRSCYSFPSQAAEYYLRNALLQFNIDDLTFVSSESITQNDYKVIFLLKPKNKFFEVFVEKLEQNYQARLSCSSQKMNKPTFYSLKRFG